MSRTHRAGGAEFGAAGPGPQRYPGEQWRPEARPRPGERRLPGAHREPIGSQVEGMEAIRAVWERAGDSDPRRPRPRRPSPLRKPRHLVTALFGTLVCACLLMFLAWISAPALWMTMGHGQSGTVTVTDCSGGFAPGCTGVFEGGGWTAQLRLTGEVTAADVGGELPAHVTGPRASSAYVGGFDGLVLRWAPAVVLYMICGFALVAASGATRLYEGRGAAIGLCWTAAVGVWIGAMAFAW